MNRIRVRLILLVSWLVIFFNAGRLLSPLRFSNLAIAFVLVMGITTLAASRTIRLPLWVLLSVPAFLFLGLKVWIGSLASMDAVALSILEVCAITLTTLLCQWVSQALDEFEHAIEQITIGHREKMITDASVGQSFIYREVRRARNHHRPLALLSVGVDEKTIKITLDRLVQEVQLSMMKQYKLSGLSKVLCDELEDCAVIVQNNDQFLVALPETAIEEMPILIERLRKQVAEHVGVDLKIGTATFPKDGYTFEGLVDKAIREMKTDLEPQPFIDLEQLSVKRHTN